MGTTITMRSTRRSLPPSVLCGRVAARCSAVAWSRIGGVRSEPYRHESDTDGDGADDGGTDQQTDKNPGHLDSERVEAIQTDR